MNEFDLRFVMVFGQKKSQRRETRGGLPLARGCGLGNSMSRLAVDMRFRSRLRTLPPSAAAVAADYCLEWAREGRRSLLRASPRHCRALSVLAALEEQFCGSLKENVVTKVTASGLKLQLTVDLLRQRKDSLPTKGISVSGGSKSVKNVIA